MTAYYMPPIAPPKPAVATDTKFVRDQEPDADFMRALREESPISDEHSWLLPVWEAGEEWMPGQRWVLYEMVHVSLLNDMHRLAIMSELRGPHPRSEGHLCSTNVPHQFQCLCRRKKECWVGGPCELITLQQYQLYQKTGYFGSAYWVVQGDKGGHKREITDQKEIQLLKWASLPTEAPRIGDLPFAPLDGRVLAQVRRHNRLKALGMSLAEFKNTMTGEKYKLRAKKMERDLRGEYVKWLSEQLEESTGDFVSAARKGELQTGDVERSNIEWRAVSAQADEHYINTGEMLHPSQVKGALLP